MTIPELVDMVSIANGKTLTDRKRETLIRMLERAAMRGADVDMLIRECKAYMD